MLKRAMLEKNSSMVHVLSQYVHAYELCCTLSVFLAVTGNCKDKNEGANLGTVLCFCVVAVAFIWKICF